MPFISRKTTSIRMRGWILSTLLIVLICLSQCEEVTTENGETETPESAKQDGPPEPEDGSSGIQHNIALFDKKYLQFKDKVHLFCA